MKSKKLVATVVLGLSMMLFTACSNSGGSNGGAKEKKAEEVKFPTKNLTMIVQANPGGLSDQVSRTIADQMAKDLGKSMVCQYKPGGSGAVGMSFVEKSKPDGYTIGHTPLELVMLKSLGFADVSPDKFTLLGRAYITYGSLAIKTGDERFKNIKEFLDYAKAHPGEIKVGNAGTGSIWHLGAIGFEKAANIKLNHVPFEGSAKSVAALMGGHVDAVVAAPIELLSGVQGQKMAIIATMGDKRSDNFKDVPTLKESGVNYTLSHWGGFVAPKGLPADVEKKLVASLKKAVESAEFKKFLNERAMEPAFMTGDEYTKFCKEQGDLFAKIISEAGLKKS